MLKKIVLSGFKSFADRLDVDFAPGITAIVGPNGCGKSNISDAIRWVLGEQSSKALRGTSMQDVIFKGTENRRQLSYCEVALHFDNSRKIFPVDYEDLVISRKLYRSGESEYSINGQIARLKDIATLLHDSGIDRDGMTIIGQGQVTDLVNSKPESRREIFNSAAGIEKFKKRRDEALRKLERVAAELVRVNDVISEIDRTLSPLLKQAANAKKYLELRDELKTLEINAFIHAYDTAAERREELNEKLNEISDTLSTKQTEIAELVALGANSLEQLSTIDVRAEALRQQVLKLSVGLERHLGEGKLVAEKLTLLNSRHDEARLELERVNERYKVEQENLASARTLLESLKKEYVEAEEGLRKAQYQLRDKQSVAEKQFDLLGRKQKLETRKETIENLIQSGEGYKFSVRKIIEESKRNQAVAKNIVGVVAKLLTVPEHLETAIEVALGAAAQNIVTEDEDNARSLIEHLSRNNWGRATFLPLTSAKVKLFSAQDRMDLEKDCVVGIASELVLFDKKVANAVTSLLGRVVVVDELKNAISLARSTNYAFKIVTVDGDVIETRGSITGGAKNALNNNLWHANSLKQIEEELKEVDTALANLGTVDAKEMGEEVTKLKIRVAALESEIASTESQVKRGDETTDLYKHAAEDRRSALGAIESQIESTKNLAGGDEEIRLLQESEKRLEAAEQDLASFDVKKEELRTAIATAENNRAEAQVMANNLQEDFFKTKNSLELIDVELNNMQERVMEDYGLNYASCYPLKEDNFDADEAREAIATLRKAIARLGNVNIDAIEQSKEAGERFESYTTQVNDLTTAKQDLEQVISDLSNEMVERFKTSFAIINKNFGEIFKELFGGGNAKLELTDPVNVLESGVEIIAEPKGKKLSNITLLSGGEKALTAIAILFAILKLRPMPFCVLDEIEAPLDEVNVARFASYLRKYTADPCAEETMVEADDNCCPRPCGTQFIVITHRKPTMELADNLYGVTMQERGVSKIVSVKLEAYASAS